MFFFLRRGPRFLPAHTVLNKTVGTGRALDMLARHFNVQATTVSTRPDVFDVFLLMALKQPRLSRRKTASQEEFIVLETDRLLREQIEDGCELSLNLNPS